jgi:hypothetical protein
MSYFWNINACAFEKICFGPRDLANVIRFVGKGDLNAMLMEKISKSSEIENILDRIFDCGNTIIAISEKRNMFSKRSIQTCDMKECDAKIETIDNAV